MKWGSTNNGFNLGENTRLLLNLSFFILAAVLTGSIITYKMQEKVGPGSDIWQNNSLPISKLGDIFQRYHRVNYKIFSAVKETDREKIKEYILQISEDSQTIDEELDICAKSSNTLLEVKLYKDAVLAINKYWEHLYTVENLILQNKHAEARKLLSGQMAEASGDYLNVMDTWIKFNLKQDR